SPVQQALVAQSADQPRFRVADGVTLIDQGQECLLQDVFRVLRRDTIVGEQRLHARPHRLEKLIQTALSLGGVRCGHSYQLRLSSWYATTKRPPCPGDTRLPWQSPRAPRKPLSKSRGGEQRRRPGAWPTPPPRATVDRIRGRGAGPSRYRPPTARCR